MPFSTFFKWQNFGAAAAEKFKVAKRQNSFQSDALVLLSLSLMYLVIVKVVGAISKCVLVVESLNELKVQVTLVSVHFISIKRKADSMLWDRVDPWKTALLECSPT